VARPGVGDGTGCTGSVATPDRYGGPVGLGLDDAFTFVGQHSKGVLVTLRRNGRPQLSNILYLPGSGHSVRISLTESRAKTKNLRRDPRASLHVTRDDFYAYVVLDGEVALSPVAQAADDPVVDELVEMYRLARGEHPDWDEYRSVMVSDGRVVATLSATRAYGMLGA
jgi:PPOX class probable F420-dependent enzyme